LLSIPTQTLANPTVGFRIVTSGDQIAVDFVQNENGAFGTSPIPTTTTAATRAADVADAIGALRSLVNVITQSVLIDLTIFGFQNVGQRLIGMNSLTAGSANNIGTDVSVSLGSGTLLTGAKCAYSQQPGATSIVGNMSAVVNGTTPTDPTGNVWGPMYYPSVGYQSFGYTRRLTVWNSRLADATLQALTAP
jgi:hypothetical protein